jgi:hypothetical protein
MKTFLNRLDQKYLSLGIAFVICLLVVAGIHAANAQTGPTASPPNGDVTPNFDGLTVDGTMNVKKNSSLVIGSDWSVEGGDNNGDLSVLDMRAGKITNSLYPFVTVDSNLNINDNLSVSENLNVSGDIYNLRAEDPVLVGDNFKVEGDSEMDGDLTIPGGNEFRLGNSVQIDAGTGEITDGDDPEDKVLFSLNGNTLSYGVLATVNSSLQLFHSTDMEEAKLKIEFVPEDGDVDEYSSIESNTDLGLYSPTKLALLAKNEVTDDLSVLSLSPDNAYPGGYDALLTADEILINAHNRTDIFNTTGIYDLEIENSIVNYDHPATVEEPVLINDGLTVTGHLKTNSIGNFYQSQAMINLAKYETNGATAFCNPGDIPIRCLYSGTDRYVTVFQLTEQMGVLGGEGVLGCKVSGRNNHWSGARNLTVNTMCFDTDGN